MVRLTDRPDMTLDVYRGRKTTIQQQQQFIYMCNGFADSVISYQSARMPDFSESFLLVIP